MNSVRVVCTGATGIIGRRLPRDVVALRTRLEATPDTMGAELAAISGDVGAFIHLAAMTSVSECEREPERAFELNVHGTEKWLRAAAATGCRRFVHVSTSHVFKPTATPERLTPDRPMDAVSVYGRTKLEAERRMAAAALDFDMEIVIARVFSIIAADMPPDSLYAALQRRARERDFSPLPGYKNVRDFIPADEAASRLWNLATARQIQHRIFHVCTGEPRSVRELAIEVMRRSGIDDAAFAPMFADNNDRPNFLVSMPTPLP